MKSIYGAPATGVPISEDEARRIRSGEPFTTELMTRELSRLTEIEAKLRGGYGAGIEYDYGAFRAEANIFTEGSVVHVLRHLRYDRHELHSHGFFEIACQLSGEGTLDFDGESVSLHAGDICLIAPGVMHRLSAPADDSIILKIIMRRSDFDDIYRSLMRSGSLLTRFLQDALYSEQAGWLLFETGADPDIRETLLRLRYFEVRAALTDDIMKQALVMQLFCFLTERCIDRARAAFSGDRTGQILACINANFRTVTLGELAERFHFSEGYLSRIVKRATGQPFTELVNSLKIQRACELLVETELPIQQIIFDCGFGCKEFFYKTFKRMRGTTPTAYREEHRQNA